MISLFSCVIRWVFTFLRQLYFGSLGAYGQFPCPVKLKKFLKNHTQNQQTRKMTILRVITHSYKNSF